MKFFAISFLLLGSIIKLNAFETNSSKYGNKRFNEWTWLTSHNSHLNEDDNSVVILAANQFISIDRQLEYGVRAFMLDIDLKVCNDLEKLFDMCRCEGVCLCHGQCSKGALNNLKDGMNVRNLEYALKKIVDFLRRNEEEIITIFLEDYLLETQHLLKVFKRVKYLSGLIFNPYASEWNVVKNGWPKIIAMVQANKRLLIVDDEQRGKHAGRSSGIIRSRDFILQNHFQWFQDDYVLNLTDLRNETQTSLKAQFNLSRLSINIEMSRCFSLHKYYNRTTWDERNPLDLNATEHEYQLVNREKLFLFNHFYGVLVDQFRINPITLNLMNSNEFVMKRINEKCGPGTRGRMPNFIALDFIDKNTYKNIIKPINLL
jgi:hypothetical protein